jgi:hypothetical protein
VLYWISAVFPTDEKEEAQLCTKGPTAKKGQKSLKKERKREFLTRVQLTCVLIGSIYTKTSNEKAARVRSGSGTNHDNCCVNPAS